MNYNRTMTHLQ